MSRQFAASLPPALPVIAESPEPTPLPASGSRIDPKFSQELLQRVEVYLSRLDEFEGRDAEVTLPLGIVNDGPRAEGASQE